MNRQVSVVIGSYNRLLLLKKTIESVRKELINTNHEIIIVDGGSRDGSMKWLLKQKDIITIIQHNHGFFNGKKIEKRSWGYFMNLGFKCAQGKYICMISDDCLVVPNAIINGIKLADERIAKGEKIGAVAFYWRNFTEPRYYVSLGLGEKIFVNHGLFLKKALEDVGYIDENYNFYCGDTDLCLKIFDAGYICIDSPTSFIEHCPHTDLLQRRINNKHVIEDCNLYLDKWEDKYKKNTKESIFMDYTDKYKTYTIFEKSWYVRRRKIINTIGSKLKYFVKRYYLDKI